MTYSLSNNCTKNYYNRTLTVQVIVEDVVTWIFLKHSVYINVHTLRFNGHFPGEPGLAGCPLNSPPLTPELCILWEGRKLSSGHP